jgi:hypothetical protein
VKKLISLISTKGKTPQQITREVIQAYKKYQSTNKEAIKRLKQMDK